MGVQRWLLVLFLVASIVDPGLAAQKKFLYHLPWACSVLHTPSGRNPQVGGTLIGAGAIIEENKVLVSVDNFNEKVPNSTKRYFEVINEISVHAGTNYMDPIRVKQKLGYSQTRKVKNFVIAFKRPQGEGRWEWRKNPTDISEKAGVEYGPYGLAFNVGILDLEQPFGHSPYVLPMLIKGPDVPGRTKDFLNKLERAGLPSDICITYSWNAELNKIRYHEVTYLPARSCQNLFCYWSFSKCAQFPLNDYLSCFKSVKYADVCPNARGAALYCPSFDHSVLAILTTAPSCGKRHMPGVYTTLPLVIDLFEEVFKVKFEPEKRTSYDVFSLPQRNDDYYGILE